MAINVQNVEKLDELKIFKQEKSDVKAAASTPNKRKNV